MTWAKGWFLSSLSRDTAVSEGLGFRVSGVLLISCGVSTQMLISV